MREDRDRMIRFAMVVALLAVLGQVGPASAPPLAAQTEGQFRAYWVDSFGPGLYSEAEIDRLVADTKAANMNAIIAQIVRRADCLCNRAKIPRTEAEIDPVPFDPLETLIHKAHAEGLEVHAWLNTTIMWADDTPPEDPNHVFYSHGPSVRGYDNWVMLRRDGAKRGGNLTYFDPGHPAAADYMVNMFLSIVRNYDVDGINLDYVRYPEYISAVNSPSWGYNAVALARFQAVTGRSDVPVPADPQWMAWRREQVTNIVRRVYVETSAIKPRVRVSADTITFGDIIEDPAGWTQTRAYRDVLQDWRGWMEEGILDLNIPMNYRRERTPSSLRALYEEWNRFIKDHQYRRHAAIGTALFLNPIDDTSAQIRKALAPSPAGHRAKGWVGFSYRIPDLLVDRQRRQPEEGRLELARSLTQLGEVDLPKRALRTRVPVFAGPASIPLMPWKQQPTTGHLTGRVSTLEGSLADQVRVDLYNAASNVLVASRRTDGIGWFGFIDLGPGEYRLSVEPSSKIGTASTVVSVIAGQMTSVQLVLSR